MKRKLTILFAILFLLIIKIAFTFLILNAYTPIISNYNNRIDFEAEKWKSWEQTDEEPSLRWNMIHDLESKFDFNGMSRDKLTVLLGKPDNELKDEISYFLGFSGHGIDTGRLIFELKNDIVIHYYVWHG